MGHRKRRRYPWVTAILMVLALASTAITAYRLGQLPEVRGESVTATPTSETTPDDEPADPAATPSPQPPAVLPVLDRQARQLRPEVISVQGVAAGSIPAIARSVGKGWRSFPALRARGGKAPRLLWRGTDFEFVRGSVRTPSKRVRSPLVVATLRDRETAREVIYVTGFASWGLTGATAKGQRLRILTELRATGLPVVVADVKQGIGSGGAALGKPTPALVGRLGAQGTETVLAGYSAEVQPAPQSVFRVSSFNILGASHTAGRGGKGAGRPSLGTRTAQMISLLRGADIDVVGFQELQPPQLSQFQSTMGGSWSVYPGASLARIEMHNSLAWRTDTWKAISLSTVPIPYFGGNQVRMPVALLEHLDTGQQIYFANFHNPADTREHRGQQRFRTEATRRQIDLAQRLTASGTPVIFTGDMNERSEYFCALTGATSLRAANGGSNSGSCQPPAAMGVDWIFGSPEITFSSYSARRDAFVLSTSDHPFLSATATVGPEQIVSKVRLMSVTAAELQPTLTAQARSRAQSLAEAGAGVAAGTNR